MLSKKTRNITKISFNSLVSSIKVLAIKKRCGLKKDPLVPLFTCNDYEGSFSPKECKAIAPRLREIVKSWGDNDYDKIQALELAHTMEQCAINEKVLVYS